MPGTPLENFSAGQLEEIWRADAAQSLIFFPEFISSGSWQPAPHLVLLAEKLQAIAKAVADRDESVCKRLIIQMPPRHGKSEFTSAHFPAWFLGNYPDLRVLLTSYGADLAEGFGRRNRNLLAEWGPVLWGTKISSDSSAANRWDIEGRRGGMTCAGVGGPITGKGGHICIIDDPIKNDEEANSPTYREKIWDWYRTTFRTRVEPGGAIIVIMTRWHEDDLVGRLLKQAKEDPESDQWEALSLPAIAEKDDPLGRQPGRALWSIRYNEKDLEKIRRTLGTYWWSALYQQRPMPDEGGIFKRSWFRYFSIEPEFYVLKRPQGEHRVRKGDCFVFQTIDLAASVKTTADFFVISTWAVTMELDVLLLDVFRDRIEGPEQRQHLLTQFNRQGARLVAIESVQYQLTFVQEARRKGLPAIELRPSKDKVSRALPMAARYEAGTVYHLEGGHYLDTYENEVLIFPNGENDDQVDTASAAGEYVTTYGQARTGVAPDDWIPSQAPSGTVNAILERLKQEREEEEEMALWQR